MKVRLVVLVLIEALVHQRKSLVLILVKQTHFPLSLHYDVDNSYLFVNGKEIFMFKVNNKNVNFPTQFCLGSISNWFDDTDSREVSLKGNVYDFSVDYNAIDKSDISNIHKDLMVKNNMKSCSGLLKKCLLYYWFLVDL